MKKSELKNRELSKKKKKERTWKKQISKYV